MGNRRSKKKIGDLNCQNAFTNYYGRRYEAWFTTEIPIGVGPWKLNGLPGLIVEASSTDSLVIFKMESFKASNTTDTEIAAPTDGEKISGGYISFRKKQVQSLINESAKPGVKITVGEVSVRRFEKTAE
ncbi:MAG: GLPGLI family protein [Niabella sp.]